MTPAMGAFYNNPAAAAAAGARGPPRGAPVPMPRVPAPPAAAAFVAAPPRPVARQPSPPAPVPASAAAQASNLPHTLWGVQAADIAPAWLAVGESLAAGDDNTERLASACR
jgi:hypothetical protein